MTDNIVIITTETTKDKLIDYIGHPCTTNWRRLAKQEKLNKPVKNGGSAENVCSVIILNNSW